MIDGWVDGCLLWHDMTAGKPDKGHKRNCDMNLLDASLELNAVPCDESSSLVHNVLHLGRWMDDRNLSVSHHFHS